MKNKLVLLAASCSAIFLSGCLYDDGYGSRSVTVSTGGYSPYYGDGYDKYSPYYAYSGQRYYRSGSRYVYYSNNRPFYVTRLPSGANYVTPPQHRSPTTSEGYRRHAASGYDNRSQRRSELRHRGTPSR